MKTGRPASARVSGEPARVASATATTLRSVIYARTIAQLRNCETDRKRQSLFRTHHSQVVPEVRTARRWDVRRFWAVLINFGRFQRRYAPPKTHLDIRFPAGYGTLFKECTRSLP